VTGLENPLGGDMWYHGSRAYPADLARGFLDPMFATVYAFEDPGSQPAGHWNAALGTHFAACHTLAEEFANGDHESGDNEAYEDGDHPPFSGVAHARLHVSRPKVYRSEHDIDREVYAHEHAAGNHPGRYLYDSEDGPQPPPGDLDDEECQAIEDSWPDTVRLIRQYGTGRIPDGDYEGGHPGHPVQTTWLNSHPDRWEIGRRFRDRLIAAGYDAVAYLNEWETRPGDDLAAMCVIVFDPARIETLCYHDVIGACDPDPAAGTGQAAAPAGPAAPSPAPAGGTYTHGQWQQAVESLHAAIAELPPALEVMLASLTADAGRTQVAGVMTLTDQAMAWAAAVKIMLDEVNARELPVVDTVAAAGGTDEIADVPYLANA
jgi:hypothetical protein